MTDYIEREAVLRGWPLCDEPADAYQYIRSYPADDVRPVVRGKWKPRDLTWGRSFYYCSACEDTVDMPTVKGIPMFHFCPNCGADMRP